MTRLRERLQRIPDYRQQHRGPAWNRDTTDPLPPDTDTETNIDDEGINYTNINRDYPCANESNCLLVAHQINHLTLYMYIYIDETTTPLADITTGATTSSTTTTPDVETDNDSPTTPLLDNGRIIVNIYVCCNLLVSVTSVECTVSNLFIQTSNKILQYFATNF